MPRNLSKLVSVLALTLLVGTALAQENQEKKRPQRPSTTGILSSITNDAITIKGADGNEVTFDIDKKAPFSILKPMKAEEIKEAKWAVVRGKVSEDKTNVEARMLIVSAKPPEPPTPLLDKMKAAGLLTIKDGAMTIKAGEQTLAVKADPKKTRIFSELPFKRETVKPGLNVMIDAKMSKDEKVALAVYIMPVAKDGAKKAAGGQKADGAKKAAGAKKADGAKKAGGKKGAGKKNAEADDE